ncbi:MAG TPA: YggS family pyridoxal phosphate enzyme [Nocardioidaceae bacterium]|nr:YggS family pyridoxal phosphate enzyme [Nocardioidaceae bacterium]
MSGRREDIATGLATVRERIAAACRAAGRDPSEVTLTVVTKYFPATDVRILASLGVTDVGENRHQEAAAKAAETRDLGLRWHFIGGLQSNKAAAVARYADVVESVDRPKLLAGLARGAQERATGPLDCLVQVNLDQGPGDAGTASAARPGPGPAAQPTDGPTPSMGRAGASPAEVVPLAEKLAGTEGLALRGVMAVAPLGEDPRPAFARLADVAERVRRAVPTATWISAGMSGDLEHAVAAGATHVRIGSAVLGPRPRIK